MKCILEGKSELALEEPDGQILVKENQKIVGKGYHSNPNLLDNWYFPEPVNQRGMTSYVDSSGSGIYTIDRWVIYNKTALTMSDGALSISFPGDPANGTYIMGQVLEQFKALRGKTVTLSLLTSSLSEKMNLFAQFQPDYTGNIQSTSLETAGLISMTFTVPENAAMVHVGVDSFDKTPSIITPLAIKLELGPIQTLAHKDADGNWILNDPPPNFQQELAKCQRYQITNVEGAKTWENGALQTFLIPTPAAMRATPAIMGTLSGGIAGDNYYHAIPSNVIHGVSLYQNGVYVLLNTETKYEKIILEGTSGLDANL